MCVLLQDIKLLKLGAAATAEDTTTLPDLQKTALSSSLSNIVIEKDHFQPGLSLASIKYTTFS